MVQYWCDDERDTMSTFLSSDMYVEKDTPNIYKDVLLYLDETSRNNKYDEIEYCEYTCEYTNWLFQDEESILTSENEHEDEEINENIDIGYKKYAYI